MSAFDIAEFALNGGGSAAMVALAWYARELRKDFKHAQVMNELKHDNLLGRVDRVEKVIFDK
jgi:hypothetical protein